MTERPTYPSEAGPGVGPQEALETEPEEAREERPSERRAVAGLVGLLVIGILAVAYVLRGEP
ncbi:MAG: hypothetical protein KY393_02050, partial [Actinobacteria bacterium]|nr:hypothetical protein [Actinomycetota bacterium]